MEHSEILALNRLTDSTLVKELVANSDKFYLIPANCEMNLCEVIDQLSKNSTDKSTLTRVRIAYDLKFALPTALCRGSDPMGRPVGSLAELLEQFDYDDNLAIKQGEDYHVVIDDDKEAGQTAEEAAAKKQAADEAVAKLFQQTVFLNLNLDIKKKSEIRKALIKTKFRAAYSELRDEIADRQKYLAAALEHSDLTDSGKQRVQKMADAFAAMLEELAKARQRPLRIAAMGTKKAGKSVVINSLLKCDYAPTSSELPTPNVIKYIPAPKDAPLTLDYKDEVGRVFGSAKELSDYIGAEFEKAQKHTGEGSGLADMIIHYPSDELNGYEVWDTPGPNFAGAGEEHHKIADECIKNTDVCIFVMNYSNHLTDDEVKFLEKIHTIFQEENKFYSLFITVNRIDERYAAEVEKSVNRILDYIRIRLEELDYRNIMIFGTSALQSFYLDKVLDALADNGQPVSSDDDLTEIDWEEFIDEHMEMATPVDFMDGSLKKLRRFHRIKHPTRDVVENFSGIPQLWHHVRYVGEQKVDTEIVDHVVSRCESEFDRINNALLVTELVNLSEEDNQRLRELKEQFDELRQVVDEALADVKSHSGNTRSDALRAAKYDIGRQIDSTRRNAVKDAMARSNVIAGRATLTDSDVEAMQGGSMTSNIKAMLNQIDEIIEGANKGSEHSFLRVLALEGEEISRKVEEDVNKAQTKIIAKTEEVKQSVGSDTVAGNLMGDFAVPEFPVSLSKLSSQARRLNVVLADRLSDIAQDATRIDQETRTRTVTKKNPEKHWWTFWRDKYIDVDEDYTVSVERADAGKFRVRLKEVLENLIRSELEKSHGIMRDEVEQELDEIYSDIGKQCQKIGETYEDIFHQFGDDINNALNETDAHKQAVEHDITVLKDIKENITPFFELWRGILDVSAGG